MLPRIHLLLLLLVSTRAFAFAPRVQQITTTTPKARQHQQQQRVWTLPKQPAVTYSSTTATSSTTALPMSPAHMVGALAGCVTGGFLAGGLHAIAGPDHLAALLPRCVGQRWFRAGRVGAVWGMGHGVSATVLGLAAFGLKKAVSSTHNYSRLFSMGSSVTELAVGLSLVVIGVLGWKEAQEFGQQTAIHSLSAAANPPASMSENKRAVLCNGLLHGFSWDGAPSLAPALAVATWGGSLTFLLAYAAGTVVSMTAVTTLIGEATRQASRWRPDLPGRLASASSVVAVVMGVVWCGLAFR